MQRHHMILRNRHIYTHSIQCTRKVFTALRLSPNLLCYDLIRKCIKNIFTLKFFTQYSSDNVKIVDIYANLLKIYNMYFSIHNLRTILFDSPLGAITTPSLSVCDTTSLAHRSLSSLAHSPLLHLSSSSRLDGKRCAGIFKIAPEMFNLIQIWALGEPLKDIQRIVLILSVCLGLFC